MFLAKADDIKLLDKLASEKYGIPVSELMENAGRSIFNELVINFPNRKFAVFCGKGNNGGDGLVVARLLKANGFAVKVYTTHDESEFTDVSRIAFAKLKEEKVEILSVTDDVDKDALIIDALLGVSVNGAPRGAVKTAIDKISSLSNPVISIDLPSGLSADDGTFQESVVKADYTYTLALDKIGLNTLSGKALCGKKKVLDIGIPDQAVSEVIKVNQA